jgi:DivIVA domain-containing protein
MPFAPHEIENKRFVIGLRGYSTAEVDAFLRAVASDYATALAAAETTDRESPVTLVAEIGRVMGQSREAAEAEAAEIRRAAEEDAAAIREAARLEAEACYAEVDRQAAELARIDDDVRLRLEQLERALADGIRALGGRPQITPRVPA